MEDRTTDKVRCKKDDHWKGVFSQKKQQSIFKSSRENNQNEAMCPFIHKNKNSLNNKKDIS